MRRFLFSAFTALFGLVALEAKELGVLREVERAPTIDGKLDPAEWEGATYLGKFRGAGQKEATPATEAWVCMHDATLYVAFRCEEPSPEKMRTQVIMDEKDAPVWRDDSVDFFVDLGNTGQSVFRITSNSEGTLYDAEGTEDQDDPTWDSAAIVKTQVGESAWEVEMAIPMETMRHRLARGEVIAVNAARTRFAGGERQASALSGALVRPFLLFTPLLVKGKAEVGEVAIQATRRGPFYPKHPSEWEFEAVNSGSAARELHITFPKGKQPPEVITLPPGRKEVRLAVESDAVEAMSECRITVGGREIFAASYQPREREVKARVASVKSPLFEELVEPRPDGLSKDGFILWGHDIGGPPSPFTLALRAGFEYSRAKVREELKREGAIIIVLSRQAKSLAPAEREGGLRYLIRLSDRAGIKNGALATPKGAVWPLDPHAIEAFLEDARESIALAKEHESVWGLFVGDETWVKAVRALSYFLDRPAEAEAQLKAMDAEIKASFGFGKYGLPQSSKDTNPYRWIATYRWMIKGMGEVQVKLRKLVEKECPRLKIVGWDNHSGHFPYEIGRWRDYFDVMTGQLYPSLNKYRDLFGFNTRLLKDLSGIEEMWPCAHIEHYAANFTPRETEHLLSEVFAAGATGLHLYMSDTKGRRANSGCFATDRFGAPERWAAVVAVLDRLRESPFRVKQAEPDTAIFYSNTSYQGQGGERPATNEVEWLYNLIGPRAQGALKFIEEYRLEAADLSPYKAIYIPYAPIMDDHEYQLLKRYVEDGGTLVLCDPSAFQKRSDGSERDLTVFARAKNATPVNRERGISRVSVGKGNLLIFANNPLNSPSVISNQAWIDAFRDIQKSIGAVTDNRVWRFRFPEAPPYVHPSPKGLCFTDNHFQWVLSKPQSSSNAGLGGSYRLSSAISGEPGLRDISFEEGKLTDRRRAIWQATNQSPNDSVLKWATTEPVEIDYQFNAAIQPQLVKLFYRGTLPAGKVEVFTANNQWEQVATWGEEEPTPAGSVVLKELPLSQSRGARVRLHFEPTASGSFLTLAETDVWGER